MESRGRLLGRHSEHAGCDYIRTPRGISNRWAGHVNYPSFRRLIKYQNAPLKPPHMMQYMSAILRDGGLWKGLWPPDLGTSVLAYCLSVGYRLGAYPALRSVFEGAQARIENNPEHLRKKKTPVESTAADFTGGALGYACCDNRNASYPGRRRTDRRSETRNDWSVWLRNLNFPFEKRGPGRRWSGPSALVLRSALLSASHLATYGLTKSQLLALGHLDGSFVQEASPLWRPRWLAPRKYAPLCQTD